MKISIIGTGYVGLSTGLVLASLRNEVYFVDLDRDKLENLKKGKAPFHEPYVEDLLKKVSAEKRAFFTTDYSEAIPGSEVIFICVGTPPKINGEADTRQVKTSLRNIARNLNKKTAVVLKSTVPVGTAREVKRILERAGEKDTIVVSNPEFLREGHAIEDTFKPDRIIIGVSSKEDCEILLKLYEPIIKQKFDAPFESRLKDEVPVVITENISAELIKYASNAFLATKISFINEMANISENVGGDITDIAKGVGLDPRIGDKFLNAGIGWGGSCFPKDIRALHQIAGSSGYLPVLLKSVIEVNNEQRYRFLQKIVNAVGGEVEGKSIAVLGVAFKAGTDDIRESPAVEIIGKLADLGAKVRVYDPMAMGNAQKVLPSTVYFASSAQDAAKGAEALVIATEWAEFKSIDLKKTKMLMNKPTIVDGRNLLTEVDHKGFKYLSVGCS